MTVREPASASGPGGAGGSAGGPSLRARGGRHRPHRRHWPRRRHRLLRWVAIAAAAVIMLAVVAFGGLLAVTPSAGNAQDLARAQARGHHVDYPGPQVPARFAASIVATEDHRFYSEPGIDIFAIGRVVMARLTGGGDQGGATLDQQLAKLLYPAGSGPRAKAEQVALAIKLDLHYSKAQILQMYADVAYFGHGLYGLNAASCGYFGERPAGLSWAQAAMLAGLVLAPSADNPVDHPALARGREEHVLGRLAATHVLTRAQAAAALARPLHPAAAAGGGCAGGR
jgi:membrane peptidoglycan carboxypeptidase